MTCCGCLTCTKIWLCVCDHFFLSNVDSTTKRFIWKSGLNAWMKVHPFGKLVWILERVISKQDFSTKYVYWSNCVPHSSHLSENSHQDNHQDYTFIFFLIVTNPSSNKALLHRTSYLKLCNAIGQQMFFILIGYE